MNDNENVFPLFDSLTEDEGFQDAAEEFQRAVDQDDHAVEGSCGICRLGDAISHIADLDYANPEALAHVLIGDLESALTLISVSARAITVLAAIQHYAASIVYSVEIEGVEGE